MADDTTTTSEEIDAESEAPRSGLSPMLRMALVLTFVLVVILVECAVAFMVLPTAEDVALMAQAQLAVQGENAVLPDEPTDPVSVDLEDTIEMDLGVFGVTSYQPKTNTTLRIDLHLYGTVREDDHSELMTRLEDNQHRYREKVLVILRSAEISDLEDAGLGLIKRRILEKTNRTLGKVLLQEVLFSDFSFIEQ